MRRNEALVITLASGKGGVGKTSIAANLSYTLSQLGQTMLIDLDLQNQGCTSLFRNYSSLISCNAFLILNRHDWDSCDYTQVAGNLYFVPAVSLQSPPNQECLYETISSFESARRIYAYLDDLLEKTNLKYVVIDCHGGMDFLSSAIFYYADDSLIITEPDPVTFNGTLELLRTYEDAKKRLEPLLREGKDVAASTHGMAGSVDIVVNRLGGKLSFKSLERLYNPYLKEFTTGYDIKIRGIHYFPNEELLRESFGDYPFYVELAPSSIFGRKIRYLAYCLTNNQRMVVRRSSLLKEFGAEKKRKKVIRLTRSREYIAGLRLMNWAMAGLFFILIAAIVVLMSEGLKRMSPNMAGTILGVYFAELAFYATRTLKSMFDVYRGRWRYEVGVARKGMLAIGGIREMRIALLSVLVGVISFGVALTPLAGLGFAVGLLVELGWLE
jgi:cellulose biosynthesis protein BcsQ